MLPACENIFAWAFVFLRKLYCYFWGCLVIFLICFWVHESPTVFKSSLHFYCDNLHILCTFFFFLPTLASFIFTIPFTFYTAAYQWTHYICQNLPMGIQNSLVIFLHPTHPIPVFKKITETFILVKCFYEFLNVALWSLALCLFPHCDFFFFKDPC